MTVLETVNKYDLALYEKTYKNTSGKKVNLTNLDKLKNMKVQSVSINHSNATATITLYNA